VKTAFQTPWQTPRLLKTSGLMAALLAAALLAASCGGGGGGGTTPAPTVVATTDSFGNDVGTDPLAGFGIDGGSGGGFGAGDSGGDGTGGEGPPLVNATVLITDSAGKTATALTNADGYYRVKITGMKEPLVVRMVGQNGKVYTSMRADPIKTGFNTVNVTSFTDKIASNLALAAKKKSAAELLPVDVNAAAISTEQAALKAALLPALKDAGADSFDFISTPFKADGTKIDKVLDLVRHEITSDGSTKLFTKAPTTDANGAVTSTELSASNTLPVGDANDLDFTKLKALQTGLNTIASLTQAQRDAAGSGAKGYIHHQYSQNTMSLGEQLRQAGGYKRYNTVIDSTDVILGAKFEIPELLAKFESTPGSGVFDVAVLELRWVQPDKSYRSTILNARRFPSYVNPIEANTASKIGADWWLYGNQRPINATIGMRARQSVNLNPSTNNGSVTNKLSFHMSGISPIINSYIYDQISSTWVSANIRHVHVKGPGLPVNGLLYAPLAASQTCVGATSIVGPNAADYHGLTAVNPTSFPASPTFATSSTSSPHFWLKRTKADGTIINLPNGSASLANLSAFNAWNVYSFTVERQDLSTVTFTARNVAAALDPTALGTLPLHSLDVSDSLFTAPQAAPASITLNWQNNAAMPGAVYAWAISNTNAGINTFDSEKIFARNRTSLSSASSVSFATSDVSQWAGCNAGSNATVLHNLDSTTNTYREWNLRTVYNRVSIDQIRRWQN
jgi:hypothetical protein